MSDGSFLFVFEGPAFSEGEIDVRDLAPALLAMGDVVREANRAVNGNKAEANLKLRATNEGSFEALLSIDVTWAAALTGLLDTLRGHEDQISTANDLMDLLFKVATAGSTGAVGVFAALKWLKGRKPTETTRAADGRSAIITGPAGQIVVDNRTLVILGDHRAREAIEDFSEKTGRIEGLTAVRLDAPGRENDLRLEKEDLPALRTPAPSDEVLQQTENRRTVWLRIISSSFKEGYLWRFSDGGEKPFTASVEDTEFLAKVAEGKIALSAADNLLCEILERQSVTGSGISKSTHLEKVVEYVSGARQLPLL